VAIWAPKNGPKEVPKGPQVGYMYSSMYTIKNKPLTKSLGPFFKEKWSKTSAKQVFYPVFYHFGAIWAPPNGPKKERKGPQVGGMYDPMSKHKNKPLFLREKWSKTTRKQFYYAVFSHFGVIWASSNGSKRVLKGLQVDRMYGLSKHRNRPLSKSLAPLF
jgi:hypothetical protein